MLPNEFPNKSSFYGQSPFKKVINYPNNIPNFNPINKPKPVYHPNYSKEKYITPPIKFGVNFYFAQPKPNFYQPIIYPYNPQPQEFYYPNYNPETTSTNELFKNSLAKSGYQLTQEQSVKYKDIYNKTNIMNNNNNYYDNFNYCPINNNNNIINNIYPTITKVTNVHILSDDKTNDNKKEIKKENININNNNLNKETKVKKEEKIDTNNSNTNTNNKKRLFECSETNGIDIKAKNSFKKKRIRKSNQQIGLLSQFYSENKNWTKKQIKEISEKTGLKENKIYKWLWDQKNKEFKATKFVVNK